MGVHEPYRVKTETSEAYSRGNNGSKKAMQYPYLQEATGAQNEG